MNILITSIVDLKKSQHNRPHQLVKHLSKKHDITVLSINDWWVGGPWKTCILGVHCVTLRDNTERLKTLEEGSNMLNLTDSEKIVKSARRMLVKCKRWKNPSRDGKAAERIRRVVTMESMEKDNVKATIKYG